MRVSSRMGGIGRLLHTKKLKKVKKGLAKTGELVYSILMVSIR